MLDTRDVAAALRGGVRDLDHALEFVRSFAATWSGHSLCPSDLIDHQLDDEERQFGYPLPLALREGYRLLAGRPELTGHQDPLVPVAGLGEIDGYLVFRRENQDAAFWGIPFDRLDEDDPPVAVRSPQDGWLPFLPRMSQAWVELLLGETLFACGIEPERADSCELPAELAPVLGQRYTRVDLPDLPHWVGPQDSPIRWYAAPGRLLRLDGTEPLGWLHARGLTRADLAAVRADFPCQWVN
ncbi:hypothetical protein GCM10009738_32570 [Kitasatospora viridis]|uniref:Uncharacterized protein n=1 Tax=Kitasatospora viridis TaxID=281105 RepID=A0A561UQK4_9ACTN|nr:hypothetical protein FHX73_115510 [Kitasatospora viridis]